jgi:hypothetical protein|tara:strand:+ start:436 stop:822 length:387 start_codon:yes stop_codon:yes gene_type:complete
MPNTTHTFVDTEQAAGLGISMPASSLLPPLPGASGPPNEISPSHHHQNRAAVQQTTLKKMPKEFVNLDAAKQSPCGIVIVTALLLWGSTHKDGFDGTLKRGNRGKSLKFHCNKDNPNSIFAVGNPLAM